MALLAMMFLIVALHFTWILVHNAINGQNAPPMQILIPAFAWAIFWYLNQ